MPSSGDLDKALLYIEDLLDRALCPFMVGGLTAKSIISGGLSVDGGSIKGDKIEILIRKRMITREVLSSLRTHPISGNERTFKETETGYYIEHEGVPIEIKVIKRDYPFFRKPDKTPYLVMDLGIPNPFEAYWKVRGLIR